MTGICVSSGFLFVDTSFQLIHCLSKEDCPLEEVCIKILRCGDIGAVSSGSDGRPTCVPWLRPLGHGMSGMRVGKYNTNVTRGSGEKRAG